ncbi:MAG: hypothetical protein QT02_C0006G0042 [archaeon GW2011_AR9]|nr:MAG: hypothetical protein QT02_C0006G0042 [archaeon GW2011_AR9]MBS3120440.1 hypothetical protein [Candidatus Woesearchaeota archaeon]HIG93739.1 hypothetical protein [Candidatus Woesearchaeota archaeon]HIH12596.1 hypothetical protein [Candidatus Woesearchaeota archaeon]
MNKIISIVFIVLLLLFIQLASAANVITEPTVPSSVLPGSIFSLTLKVTNPSAPNAPPIENIQVSIDTPRSLDIDSSERTIPLLAPGQSVILHWSVQVSSSSTSNYETITISLNGDSLSQDIDVPILIKSIESSLEVQNVQTNPASFEPGKTGELRITLQNHASYSLRDIHLALELSPASLLAPLAGTEEKILHSLNAGDTMTVSLPVRALPKAGPGTYTIPLHITYFDKFGQSYTKINSIPFRISAIPQLQVSAEGTPIQGQVSEITLKVINMGLTPVQFLNLKLQHPALISSSSLYFGTLDSDDFQTEQIKILADAPFQIPVTLEFRDAENTPYTETVFLPINVIDQATAQRFGLQSSSSSSYLIIGLLILMVIIYLVQRKFRKKKQHD